ncbi:uncharacterized protein LOC110875780 [Helianthus annuus]|uniref:uncharacterized protein LOC110875780 n=1 Tax=Helianthus annuus TaxID=4232 RepID=UPI000B8F2EB5|nr:uncharacterized protein LOC110875780 [Helianthus annuus]
MANEVRCKPDAPPFKYLGLKVGANMNRISNWQPVFETFRNRLAKWKSRLLSIGGKVVITKSVLESLPTYYFSLYRAPKKIISDLEAMIRKFLWGGSSEERKLHWLEASKDCKIVDQISRNGNDSAFIWEWRAAPNSAELSSSLQQLISELHNVQISDRIDKWVWKFGSSGEFSVKEVKRLLYSEYEVGDRFVLD